MKYRWLNRKRCPHSNLGGIYGDEINHVGGWRLWCADCRRFLDGPVSLAASRKHEQPHPPRAETNERQEP